MQNKTRVVDLDLRAYFDSVRHDLLLAKVARRVNDRDVLALLKQMLKASGKTGVPQGGVISPVLSNLYLTEVDRMLERAKEVTRFGQYTYVEYARFADDLVILVDAHPRHAWLLDGGHQTAPGGVGRSSMSRSMKRRAGSWTWQRGRPLASWASTSGASARGGASGGRSRRRS